ncbi:MAG: membrane protein [Chloroflexota bacterium]
MRPDITSSLLTLGKRLSPTPRLLDEPDAEDIAARPVTHAVLDRAVVFQAAGMWLASRVAFVIFTYFAVLINSSRTPTKSFSFHALLLQWDRWDTGWYTGIAIKGYHDVYTTAFFPLYPLLIRPLTFIFGADHKVAIALTVANLAALAALIAIGSLANAVYGPGMASFAIRAAAAFPLAFFTVGGYSDGVFLAFAAFSLLFARRGVWAPAALCAFLATFTRLFGLVLILPLAWEYIRQHRESGRPLRDLLQPYRLPEFLMVVGAVPLALVIWGTYLWVRFGDAFSYFHVQRKYWDHYPVPPWQWFQMAHDTLARTPSGTYLQARVLFDLLPVLLVMVLTIVTIRRMPLSFTLFLLGTLLICVTSSVPLNFDPFTGQGRYMLGAIPIFLILGKWMSRRPGLDMLVVSLGFLLQGLFTVFFLRGGWMV